MASDLTEQELRRWAVEKAIDSIGAAQPAFNERGPWIPDEASFAKQADIYYNYVSKDKTNG